MTLESELVVFHHQLGKALSAWAGVERAIRSLLASTFTDEEANREAVSIGLYKLEGFRARLNFVDGAVGRKLQGDQALRKEWSVLQERAGTSSQSRNKLAHRFPRTFEGCNPGKRVVLVPLIIAKPKSDEERRKPPEGSLRILDIVSLELQFTALAAAVDNFRCQIAGQPKQHPESSEQPSSPPTFQQLLDRIRTGLAAPHPPSPPSPQDGEQSANK